MLAYGGRYANNYHMSSTNHILPQTPQLLHRWRWAFVPQLSVVSRGRLVGSQPPFGLGGCLELGDVPELVGGELDAVRVVWVEAPLAPVAPAEDERDADVVALEPVGAWREPDAAARQTESDIALDGNAKKSGSGELRTAIHCLWVH